MADRDIDSDFKSEWENEATQCKNCKSFRVKDGKSICLIVDDKTFEEILDENGETAPTSHCDYFQSLD
jgi:hypothetical protein